MSLVMKKEAVNITLPMNDVYKTVMFDAEADQGVAPKSMRNRASMDNYVVLKDETFVLTGRDNDERMRDG